MVRCHLPKAIFPDRYLILSPARHVSPDFIRVHLANKHSFTTFTGVRQNDGTTRGKVPSAEPDPSKTIGFVHIVILGSISIIFAGEDKVSKLSATGCYLFFTLWTRSAIQILLR